MAMAVMRSGGLQSGLLGQSRPRLPALAPTDVRYASISDQSFAASRLVATGQLRKSRARTIGLSANGYPEPMVFVSD